MILMRLNTSISEECDISLFQRICMLSEEILRTMYIKKDLQYDDNEILPLEIRYFAYPSANVHMFNAKNHSSFNVTNPIITEISQVRQEILEKTIEKLPKDSLIRFTQEEIEFLKSNIQTENYKKTCLAGNGKDEKRHKCSSYQKKDSNFCIRHFKKNEKLLRAGEPALSVYEAGV